MTHINFSPELFFDFKSLFDDFMMFWTFNSVHLAQNCIGEGFDVMTKMGSYNSECAKKLKDTFREPFKNHFEHNKKVFEKHGGQIIHFFHDYLKHAQPRYEKYRHDIYKKRLHELVDHYKDFHKKYL